MFDVVDRGSSVQDLPTIPEALQELSFGVYLVEGFRPAAVLPGTAAEPVHPACGCPSGVWV